MKRQDFEQYADTNKIAGRIASFWEEAFFKRLDKKDISNFEKIKFLDYGCGDGRYYPYLVEKGFLADNIYGVEVSRKRIRRCRDIGWKNAQFVALTHPLPFCNSFFDVVSCIDVIEHIPSNEIDFYLGEITRILKPEGFLILTTPNYPAKRFCDFIDAAVWHWWNRIKDDPTHVTKYNKSKVKALLSRHFAKMHFYVYKRGYLYKIIKKDNLARKLLVIASHA